MPQIPQSPGRHRVTPTATPRPRFRVYLAFATGLIVVLALGGSL